MTRAKKIVLSVVVTLGLLIGLGTGALYLMASLILDPAVFRA